MAFAFGGEKVSKSVLMSIQPKYCYHIDAGRKTIEIRKSRPKGYWSGKVYIYCTKGKDIFLGVDYDTNDNPVFIKSPGISFYGNRSVVIGEFTCRKIEQIHMDDDGDYEISDDDLCYSVLSRRFLKEYGNGTPLYMWRISDLVIYETPKELSEFGKTRPPQSWCYVDKE